MSEEVRQAYLEGFEGGDLRPERARMIEAYVNGVAGELLDEFSLCKLAGLKPKNHDSARVMVWKIFVSSNEKHQKTYKSEREYQRFLHAQSKLRSIWDADDIRKRLQKNVLIAQGELTVKQVVGTAIVDAPVLNLTAANQALHLLGKQQGMFTDRLEHTGSGGNPIEFVRRVEYVKAASHE
jgi:hypothetical protein